MDLILHIGTYKTGTTAIQSYFYDHRRKFLDAGLLYPETGLVTNDPYGPRHKGLTHGGHKALARWDDLYKEMDSSKARFAIISCEAFWRYPRRATELGKRLRRYNPTVVVGLRRQDHFLASLHLQRIKHQQDRTPPEEMLEKHDGWLRYFKVLSNWTEAFGREAVRPFLYDEASKDSLPLFSKAARLPVDFLNGHAGSYQKRNPTPQEWTPESVLGEELVKKILDRYSGGNEKLFARYFPGTPRWPGLMPPNDVE